MAKEYAELEALQEAFKSVTEDCTYPTHIAAEIDQILEQAAPADVVEVKRGRWIEKACEGALKTFCNQCYHFTRSEFVKVWNYCPNCGADMRVVEEEKLESHSKEDVTEPSEDTATDEVEMATPEYVDRMVFEALSPKLPCLICGEDVPLTFEERDCTAKVCDSCKVAVMIVRQGIEDSDKMILD